MQDLPYGTIYLVKGRPDVLWFALRKEQVQYLWRPQPTDLVGYFNSWGEPVTYLISGMTAKDISTLKHADVCEDVRVFITLCDLEGTLSKDYSKVYKSLVGGVFQQIDLGDYDWQQDAELVEALNARVTSPRDRIQLLTDFQSPLGLIEQLNDPEPMAYRLVESDEVKIEEFLQVLGTPASLHWHFTKAELYRLLICEDQSKCGFYLVLAGGKNSKGGLCPPLWIYLKMWMDRFEDVLEPEAAFEVFIRWVYRITDTQKYEGFLVNNLKGRNFYNFVVTPTAWRQLENVTSFLFLLDQNNHG